MLRKLILPHVFIFNILTTQAQESSLEFKTESEILLDNDKIRKTSSMKGIPLIKNFLFDNFLKFLSMKIV